MPVDNSFTDSPFLGRFAPPGWTWFAVWSIARSVFWTYWFGIRFALSLLIVKTSFFQLDDGRRLRSVLGPLAALLIITSCASSLWEAGQSVLSLWQRQRLAAAESPVLNWSMLLAARASRLAAAREGGQGPLAVTTFVVAFPGWPEPVQFADGYMLMACDAGWLGLPPPRC